MAEEAMMAGQAKHLLVADFDRAGWKTNLGDPFGGWDKDPGDSTQFCRVRLVDKPRVGEHGFSVQLEYDVDSPNPAFNGFWLKLPSITLRDFGYLSFAIRGDADRGFTSRVKLELKDHKHSAVYILREIKPAWVQVRIPLWAFRDIRKIKQAKEFVVVFDDETVSERVGTLYLDNLVFEFGA